MNAALLLMEPHQSFYSPPSISSICKGLFPPQQRRYLLHMMSRLHNQSIFQLSTLNLLEAKFILLVSNRLQFQLLSVLLAIFYGSIFWEIIPFIVRETPLGFSRQFRCFQGWSLWVSVYSSFIWQGSNCIINIKSF